MSLVFGRHHHHARLPSLNFLAWLRYREPLPVMVSYHTHHPNTSAWGKNRVMHPNLGRLNA